MRENTSTLFIQLHASLNKILKLNDEHYLKFQKITYGILLELFFLCYSNYLIKIKGIKVDSIIFLIDTYNIDCCPIGKINTRTGIIEHYNFEACFLFNYLKLLHPIRQYFIY